MKQKTVEAVMAPQSLTWQMMVSGFIVFPVNSTLDKKPWRKN
ncbi:MAG: hypothetical protein ACXWWC_13730 [Chitinophagaceae bacterium]